AKVTTSLRLRAAWGPGWSAGGKASMQKSSTITYRVVRKVSHINHTKCSLFCRESNSTGWGHLPGSYHVLTHTKRLIAYVRVCGGAGWVTTGSTRKSQTIDIVEVI